MAKPFEALLLRGSTKAKISSHAPGQQPSPGSWPDSKCSKTVEVGCSCQKVKPCQRKVATEEIEKIEIVQSAAI